MSQSRRKARGLPSNFRRPPLLVVQHAAVGACLTVLLLSEVSSMYQSNQQSRTAANIVFRSDRFGPENSSAGTGSASVAAHIEIDPHDVSLGGPESVSVEAGNRPSLGYEEMKTNSSQSFVVIEKQDRISHKDFPALHDIADVHGSPGSEEARKRIAMNYSDEALGAPKHTDIVPKGDHDTNASAGGKESVPEASSTETDTPAHFRDGAEETPFELQNTLEKNVNAAPLEAPAILTSSTGSNVGLIGTISSSESPLPSSLQTPQDQEVPDTVVKKARLRSKRVKKSSGKKTGANGKGKAISGRRQSNVRQEEHKEGANSSQKRLRFRGVPMDPVAVERAEAMGNFDNVTHLSYMLYRLIKTHHIRSLLDVPCTRTLHWMPQVLHYLDLEVPGFRYHCVVATKAEREMAEAALGDLASAEYIVSREFWRARLPATDVGLLWNVVGFVSPKQAWGLVQGVRKAGTKYLVLANYPALRNNPATGTSHGRVNIRRAPYRFTESLRVFNNISTRTDVNKQMLFYDSEHLRADDL